MSDLTTIPPPLRPEPTSDERYAITNTGNADQRDVVFGGQFLAQAIVTATLRHPGKTVRSIQSVFARPGRIDAPTELAVESIHDGRTFASDTVTAWQGDRLCARFLVLLDVDEPDVIRHGIPMPAVTAPVDTPLADEGLLVYPGTELRIVDGVDLWSVDAPTGPAETFLWAKAPALPDEPGQDQGVHQAVLAWATDGFLIATALRPHEGVGQHDAHRGLSTGVVGHTIVFHEPFRADEWLLLAHQSPYAGRGRTFGTADVFTADGRLVASYVQTNMVRFFADPALADGTQYRTVM
ncbi:MAG TPA: acyl-CoA thioesterase domain-containing protein [Acidimicrobiia bacterium]|jgi:acyl-CoA thioesterase